MQAQRALDLRRLRAPDGWTRSPLAGAAFLTLAAALLRFGTLDLQSYWFDESVTVVDILEPGLWGTLKSVVLEDVTPPLYFLLAWIWTQPFGEGESSLRSLSAVFGTATVPVAYLLGRRLASPRAGLILAALVAFSPIMLWFSQEARAYALGIFLTALSLVLWLRVLEDRGRRALVLWAVVCGLALLSHYFAGFVVAVECLWLLVAQRARRDVLAAIAALAALVVAMAPMILRQTSEGAADWVSVFDPLTGRLKELPERFLLGPAELLGGVPYFTIGAVLAAGAALAIVRAGRTSLRAAAPVAAVGAGVIVLPLLIALTGYDVFLYRYIVVAWVPLAAVAAVVLASPRLGRAGVVAAVAVGSLLLTLTSMSLLDERRHREDWRTLSSTLGRPAPVRAIAIGDWFEREPLMAYGHTFVGIPRQGYPVEEIAVVGKPDLWARGWRPFAYAPREPARLDRPPPGFRLVERRRLPTGLTLLRYRSAVARRITATSLWASNRIPPEALLLDVVPAPPRAPTG